MLHNEPKSVKFQTAPLDAISEVNQEDDPLKDDTSDIASQNIPIPRSSIELEYENFKKAQNARNARKKSCFPTVGRRSRDHSIDSKISSRSRSRRNSSFTEAGQKALTRASTIYSRERTKLENELGLQRQQRMSLNPDAKFNDKLTAKLKRIFYPKGNKYFSNKIFRYNIGDEIDPTYTILREARYIGDASAQILSAEREVARIQKEKLDLEYSEIWEKYKYSYFDLDKTLEQLHLLRRRSI